MVENAYRSGEKCYLLKIEVAVPINVRSIFRREKKRGLAIVLKPVCKQTPAPLSQLRSSQLPFSRAF